MTNSEYFEKNQISFAEVMKEFNGQKTNKSFDVFLKSEYHEHKFKIGDIVVLQLNDETKKYGWRHNIVFEILGIIAEDKKYWYNVKYLTPHGYAIGDCTDLPVDFIDKNCKPY